MSTLDVGLCIVDDADTDEGGIGDAGDAHIACRSGWSFL